MENIIPEMKFSEEEVIKREEVLENNTPFFDNINGVDYTNEQIESIKQSNRDYLFNGGLEKDFEKFKINRPKERNDVLDLLNNPNNLQFLIDNIDRENYENMIERNNYEELNFFDKLESFVDANDLMYNVGLKLFNMTIDDTIDINYQEEDKLTYLNQFKNYFNDEEIKNLLNNSNNASQLEHNTKMRIMKKENLEVREAVFEESTLSGIGYSLLSYLNPLYIKGMNVGYNSVKSSDAFSKHFLVGAGIEGTYEGALYTLDADEKRTLTDVGVASLLGGTINGTFGKMFSNADTLEREIIESTENLNNKLNNSFKESVEESYEISKSGDIEKHLKDIETEVDIKLKDTEILSDIKTKLELDEKSDINTIFRTIYEKKLC